MNKSPLIFILAILFLLPFVYSGNYIYYNQTYGTSGWEPPTKNLAGNSCIYDQRNLVDDILNNFTWAFSKFNDTNYITVNNQRIRCASSSYNGKYLTDNSYRNVSTLVNTKWGLWTDKAWQGGVSGQFAIDIYNFSQEITFSKDINTNLSLYCGNSAGMYQLYFLDKTGGIKFIWDLDQSSYCTASGVDSSKCCEIPSAYMGQCDSVGAYAKVSVNGDILNTYCENLTNNWNEDIMYLAFLDISGDAYRTDDISFKFFNGSNYLPSFNVSINSSQCLQRREDNGRLYFDISVNDPEGDTIYYFTDSLTALTENVTTKFTKRQCSDSVLLGPILSKYFCANVKDYTFQDYLVYPSSDICRVTESVYNSSMFNLYYSDSDLGRGYGLQFQSSCTAADKSIYYDMGLPSRKFNVVTEFRQLANGDAFNLSVLDESFSEVLRIRANTTNNRLLLYDNDSLVINITSQESTLLELRDVAVDTSHYTLKAWNSNAYTFPYLTGAYTTGTADMTKLNSPGKYLKIQHATGNYLLMGIQTRGAVQTAIYTTTQPQYINITGTGKYVIDIYVTDSVHLGTNYTKQSYNKYVDLCEYTAESIIEGELIEDFNVFEFFKALFGGSFREYLSTNDTNNIGPKILWWAYLIIFLSMLFSTYLIMQRFDATLPLLTSSFVVLVISYAIEYTLHFWTSLIFIALTVAWGLAPAFSGGGKGE